MQILLANPRGFVRVLTELSALLNALEIHGAPIYVRRSGFIIAM